MPETLKLDFCFQLTVSVSRNCIGRKEALAIVNSGQIQRVAVPELPAGGMSETLKLQTCCAKHLFMKMRSNTFPLTSTQLLGVENSVPWVLDVGFREKDSRIRRGHGPQIWRALRATVDGSPSIWCARKPQSSRVSPPNANVPVGTWIISTKS